MVRPATTIGMSMTERMPTARIAQLLGVRMLCASSSSGTSG